MRGTPSAESNEWITLKSFYHPAQADLFCARLSAEGISFRWLDENTVRVNPFYSDALGGARLQVQTNDLPDARTIMADMGIEPDSTPAHSDLYIALDRFTGKIPFLNKLRLEVRFFILVPFIVLSAFLFISHITKKSPVEILMSKSWCLEHVKFNNQVYVPSTVYAHYKILVTGPGFCNERINFAMRGRVEIPGFNTRAIIGQWKIQGDSLYFLNTDTLQHVFDGAYAIEFKNDDTQVIFTGRKTVITCF